MDIFFLYQELKDFHSQNRMIYQIAHYLELNYNQPFQSICLRPDVLCKQGISLPKI